MSVVFSACMPTKGRGKQARHCIERFFETTGDIETEMIVVAHPEDDNHKYLDDLIDKYAGLHNFRLYYKDCLAVAAWNDAVQYATGQFLEPWGDDFWACDGWLHAALNHYDKIGKPEVSYIGLRDDNNKEVPDTLFTMAIGTREFYKQIIGGVLIIPWYKSWYDDTEKFFKAKHAGVASYCPEAKIEHRHWCWGLAAKDKTYEDAERYQSMDGMIFHHRSRLGFPIDYPSII